MDNKYKHIALGGTFDLLHKGHKEFIKYALTKSTKVSIGITSDRMIASIGKAPYDNFQTRFVNLRKFITKNNVNKRIEIITLDNIFGTTLEDISIEGLLVTKDSIKGAHQINKKRRELKLKPLILIKFPIIYAEDNRYISSDRIKIGYINQNGKSYYELLTSSKKIILPEYLRQDFAKPWGQLFSNFSNLLKSVSIDNNQLITVGDESTASFVKTGIIPDLSIIDYKINRKKVHNNIKNLGFMHKYSFNKVLNNPGTISRTLILMINSFFQNPNLKPKIIKVDGEEDLAVLPVLLLAPLGTKIIYGLRDQGLVFIEVTIDKKAQFVSLLKKLKQ